MMYILIHTLGRAWMARPWLAWYTSCTNKGRNNCANLPIDKPPETCYTKGTTKEERGTHNETHQHNLRSKKQ